MPQSRVSCHLCDAVAPSFFNNLLQKGGTPPRSEPSAVGWPPMGPAPVTDIGSEQKGFAAPLSVLQIADGVCTRARASASGVIVDLRARDRRVAPRARQACQTDGVSAVGCEARARFLGHRCGCETPAGVSFFRQMAREAVATGHSVIEAEQMGGFRWLLTESGALSHWRLPMGPTAVTAAPCSWATDAPA